MLFATQFRLFWLARFFSSSAFQVIGVMVSWHLYEMTGSPLDLGLLGLFQFLPRLLFMPIVGVVADKVSRKWTVQAAFVIQLVAVVAIIYLEIAGSLSKWTVFACMAISGLGRALEIPAMQTLLPTIVPQSMFLRAAALTATALQLSTIIMPVIGGGLYSLIGFHRALFTPVAFYILAFFAIYFIANVKHVDHAAGAKSHLGFFLEGVRYVYSKKKIFGAMTLDMAAVLFGGVSSLLPLVADQILNVGPVGLGSLRMAIAVGALVTSVFVSRFPIHRSVGKRMFIALYIYGVATVVFGLSEYYFVSLVALFFIGAADAVSMIIRSTYIQVATPDQIRGRVSAVNALFIGASNELGEFESGLAAAVLGLMPAIIFGGVSVISITALWKRFFPELFALDRLY